MRCLLPLALVWPLCVVSAASKAPPSAARQWLQQLPLRFEENRGQSDSAVRFQSSLSRYKLSLLDQEAVLSLPSSTLRIRPLGANPKAALRGADPLPSKTRYFYGNNPSQWHTHVPHYARVRYERLYPGIDMIYYGRGAELEYDFVLAPGADPSLIKLQFTGASLRLTRGGALQLQSGGVSLTQHRPEIYQLDAQGKRRKVDGRYRLVSSNQVAFHIGRYDRSAPLIIDPVLSFSSYFGGDGIDVARVVATDASGDVWIAGHTSSPTIPTPGQPFGTTFLGSKDIFVARFRPSQSGDASLVEATYFGGSGEEEPLAAHMDNQGFLYLTGFTTSSNFPVAGAALLGEGIEGRNIFIVKLNTNAGGADALWYSTLMGGNRDEQGLAITTDSLSRIYVTGYTSSTDFRLTSNRLQATNRGGWEIFLIQIDPNTASFDNALLYSSYIGAPSTDVATAIHVPTPNNVYLAGYTMSPDFPIAGNSFRDFYAGGGDALLLKLDLNLPGLDALTYGTFLGGGALEIVYGMAADSAGRIYIAGYTLSNDFPTAGPAYQTSNAGIADLFVSRFDLSLPGPAQLTYSTYLGGSNSEIGYGLAVEPNGRVWLTGYTLSEDFPIAGGPAQNRFGGVTDAFLAQIDTAVPTLLYSTYLGGESSDIGYGVALNPAGLAFLAGSTQSADFPVLVSSFRSRRVALTDAIITSFDTTRTASTSGSSKLAKSASRQQISFLIHDAGSLRRALPDSAADPEILSGAEWLSVEDGQLIANKDGLLPGIHTGLLRLTSQYGQTQLIPVSLLVSRD